jgi:hypothetical protein
MNKKNTKLIYTEEIKVIIIKIIKDRSKIKKSLNI